MFSLLESSNGAPKPDVKLDLKVNVDGQEVIHETHPKMSNPRTMFDKESTGKSNDHVSNREITTVKTICGDPAWCRVCDGDRDCRPGKCRDVCTFCYPFRGEERPDCLSDEGPLYPPAKF